LRVLDFESSASANSATSALADNQDFTTAPSSVNFAIVSGNCIPQKMATKDNKSETEKGISKDGRWRSFPKVPNLLQYLSTGTYYARIKIKGKVIRQSLKTTVFTTAKLLLEDFKKEQRTATESVPLVSFQRALKLYRAEVEANHTIKSSSKQYRYHCIRKIELSWSELWECTNIRDISLEDCRAWAARLHTDIAAQYFNNVIDTFRLILESGRQEYIRTGGGNFSNPAADLKKAKIKATDLNLPEPEQFRELVSEIRKNSGGWGPRAADLVQFLAFSGLRLHTEANWVHWEEVDWERKEIIVRGNPNTHTKNWEIRRIPILPDMEKLLNAMKEDLGEKPSGKIVKVRRCYEALDRACRKLGIPRLSHHDLRHLFATRCIESGVDIPTVARWLGHKDGGALAMKTYGHLRNEHSQAMAAKVKF
jgi:integrase